MACNRTLKVRFIQHGLDEPSFSVERRGLFRWRKFFYAMGGGAGDVVYYEYSGKTKEDLLNRIIADKYKTTREFVHVIEHPTILKY